MGEKEKLGKQKAEMAAGNPKSEVRRPRAEVPPSLKLRRDKGGGVDSAVGRGFGASKTWGGVGRLSKEIECA
jgi:hypothetical protein